MANEERLYEIAITEDPNHYRGLPMILRFYTDYNRTYLRNLLVLDSLKLNSVGVNKDVCRIYGRVWVCHDPYVSYNSTMYAFRRPRSDPVTVRVGGHLTLSPTPRPVWDCYYFYLLLELFDADDGRVIAMQEFDWEYDVTRRGLFDRTFSWLVTGRGDRDSSVTVNYMFASNAMMAQVDVMFFENKKKKMKNGEEVEKYFVKGSIEAVQCFKACRPSRKITLFDKSEEESLEVVAGESMPLIVRHVVIQNTNKGPSLKICMRLSGFAIGEDGQVVPFQQTERTISYYLNVWELYLKSRIFYFPIVYAKRTPKLSRFLQVFVTPF